jgi:flagellar assembly factor FliW
MTKVESAEPQTLPVKPENIITLPLGLLGFEQVKKFVLLALPGEEPFMWLQMLDNRNQGFVVVPPATVMPTYAPDIVQQDIEFLGIKSAADAIVLNIVTIRANGETTINLKGPVIINRNTLVGKQCIPSNVTAYNLQHAIHPVSVAA